MPPDSWGADCATTADQIRSLSSYSECQPPKVGDSEDDDTENGRQTKHGIMLN